MENNKYYRPDKTELYIGFELEVGNKASKGKSTEWTKSVIECDEDLFYNYLKGYSELRVKYLSKECMEELGFKYTVDSYSGYFTNGVIRIGWFYDKSGVEIAKETNTVFGKKILFSGAIKNKSELKKLLKQLNIK